MFPLVVHDVRSGAKSSLLTVFCGESTENHRRELKSSGAIVTGFCTTWTNLLAHSNLCLFCKATPHRMRHGPFESLHIVQTEN